MKKIINPWRNHEGYNCFGCSPDNPIGLHLEFYEDGDYIVSTWHPQHNYQGWVDTMHGGILSTLIDEVCGWVVTRKLQTSGYTVQLNVKFRKAVPTTEPELTIRAKVSKQVRNLAYISAEITNSKGELCNEGEAIYFLMNEENTCPMLDTLWWHFYLVAYRYSVISSLFSQPNSSAILSNVWRSGCDVLVHHLLTVEIFLPNCSANHLLVLFFSTRTTLILFRSFI